MNDRFNKMVPNDIYIILLLDEKSHSRNEKSVESLMTSRFTYGKIR